MRRHRNAGAIEELDIRVVPGDRDALRHQVKLAVDHRVGPLIGMRRDIDAFGRGVSFRACALRNGTTLPAKLTQDCLCQPHTAEQTEADKGAEVEQKQTPEPLAQQ